MTLEASYHKKRAFIGKREKIDNKKDDNPSLLIANPMYLLCYISNLNKSTSVTYAGKKVGGFKVMAGLVGGPVDEAPRTPENFRKFAKRFKKIAKNALF